MFSRRWIRLVLLAIAGCGDDSGPADGPASMGTLEMGTGGLDVFEPITDQSDVMLVAGGQGAQHVWLGLRVRGLSAQPGLVEGSLVRSSDGVIVSLPLRVRLRFIRVGAYEELTGLRLVVPIGEDIAGQDAIVQARVTDPAGRVAEGEHMVHVELTNAPLPGGDAGLPDLQDRDGNPADATAESDANDR